MFVQVVSRQPDRAAMPRRLRPPTRSAVSPCPCPAPWGAPSARNSARMGTDIPSLPRSSIRASIMFDEDAGKPDGIRMAPHRLMATTTTNVTRGQTSSQPIAWPAAFTFERSPWRLVSLSMLTLFLELALIRWTAANNVHLSNIPNFVLLASFLGIGVGFLRAHSSQNLFRLAPATLAVLVAFALHFPREACHPARTSRVRGLLGHHPLSQWVSLPVIFALVVLVMAGLGQAVAALFQTLQAARRLPLRHHRQYWRDRSFLGALFCRAPAHRLGCGGGRVVRIASRHKGAVVAVGDYRCRGADAAGRIALERGCVVPLLQDHNEPGHHDDCRRP